ncbi:LolA family protein [Cohnella nanjingensis]|uniref:Outer membrane lipoprotein carrier protein LolA n=1 Tax=Cohnella nanjingensis TaxID=1387779 RepID=A0A7X0VHC3_9BACL|nr:outer membrane lipoprotein carrier protein LolA [Cohnella nanjingensis]MBB6674017.1 outer membrane lipoprotein carrier protein LolA [Cohnella nanjingensis]
MRRRLPWILAVTLLLTAVLSGCGGSKNADSIVKDLSKVADKMESYQGSGTMTLHTGQQPQKYKVEVWYQKPKFYRIALTSESRDITQIVLRNDDGVFVLTPSLNKSYRFQSDWPENQGQVYLYQTLLHSITTDNSRQFAKEKDAYVFDVMAGSYQNGSFARQKIWLNKQDYAPQKVEVTDTNANVMVDVVFDSFQFGKKFEKSAFDMQQNMASSNGQTTDQPSPSGAADGANGANGANASPDANASDPTVATPDGTADGGAGGKPDTAASGTDQTFSAIEPVHELLPQGVELRDSQDISLADGSQGAMLRYSGTYDFSLLETKSKDRAVSSNQGIILDLGFTLGLLSGDDTQSLAWTYDGVDYRLTTVDLPQEEMVKVAQAIVDQSGK